MNCLEILTEIQESTKEVYIASDYAEWLKQQGLTEESEKDYE